MNDLMNIDTSSFINQAKDTAIATWSDEKKDQFIETFSNRVRVARYILIMAAGEIYQTAVRKSYCSKKHGKIIADKFPTVIQSHHHQYYDVTFNYNDYDVQNNRCSPNTVGGRDLSSLKAIASERAQAILKGLPSLKKAVSIIDPTTANKIDQIEKLEAEGQVLKELFETLSEDIVMSELDQTMTIGNFQAMVKKVNKQRKDTFDRMVEIGKDGEVLQKEIDKALYNGLPGLSESIVEVITAHLEQYIALDEMNRRVGEQVKFGDSQAALELLRHFERDEVTVSEEVKNSFRDSLAKMQLIADKKTKPKKELAAGKKKAPKKA